MHREKPDCSLKSVMGLMVLLLFTCLILVRAKLLLTMLKLSFYHMFIFSLKMLITVELRYNVLLGTVKISTL